MLCIKTTVEIDRDVHPQYFQAYGTREVPAAARTAADGNDDGPGIGGVADNIIAELILHQEDPALITTHLNALVSTSLPGIAGEVAQDEHPDSEDEEDTPTDSRSMYSEFMSTWTTLGKRLASVWALMY